MWQWAGAASVCLLSLLSGCSTLYSTHIITTLDERKIPACIRLDVTLAPEFLLLSGNTGVMHVYAAAGGALLPHCLLLLQDRE